jgi:hypothetical protein
MVFRAKGQFGHGRRSARAKDRIGDNGTPRPCVANSYRVTNLLKSSSAPGRGDAKSGKLKMTKQPPVEIKEIGDELFVLVDGVKIAMRGSPDSAHAEMWIAIEPGWSVLEFDDGDTIQITYNGTRIH